MLVICAGVTAPNIVTGTDRFGLELLQLAQDTACCVRSCAILQLGNAVGTYQPTSQTEALIQRNRLAALIDRELIVAGNSFKDGYFRALTSLRLQIVQYLNALGAGLQPVTTFTFDTNLPSLVLAYRLYQDTDMADDLVARNDPPDHSVMPLVVEALIPDI